MVFRWRWPLVFRLASKPNPGDDVNTVLGTSPPPPSGWLPRVDASVELPHIVRVKAFIERVKSFIEHVKAFIEYAKAFVKHATAFIEWFDPLLSR